MHLDHLPGTFFGPSNLVELLLHRARCQPEDIAFTYLVDGENEQVHLTYRELDRQARAIGAWLESHDLVGERALLLYPAGLEFIAAFFGCLYAGVIAVPVYPPRRNRSLNRIQAIADDAEAQVALTTELVLNRVMPLIDETPHLKQLTWLPTCQVPPEMERDWTMPDVHGDTLAFLQYTSGSTGTPKGVVLNHANLVHNSALISHSFEHTRSGTGVFWLPSYHDMGLIGGILQPLYIGRPNVLMSPMSFLQKPYRWLSAITRFRGTTSGGPNFAYDLCVRKITPEQRKTLDLSSWRVAFNGAEPVRAETLDAFAEAFAPCGFRREAFYPVFRAGRGHADRLRRLRHASRRWSARSTPPGWPAARCSTPSRTTRACGRWSAAAENLPDQKIVIVDPETLTACPPGRIGEIWVQGPSVAQGYWQQPEATERTFRARLKDTRRRAVPPHRRPGIPARRRVVRHRPAEGPDHRPRGELLPAGHRADGAAEPSAAAARLRRGVHGGGRRPGAVGDGSGGRAAQAVGLQRRVRRHSPRRGRRARIGPGRDRADQGGQRAQDLQRQDSAARLPRRLPGGHAGRGGAMAGRPTPRPKAASAAGEQTSPPTIAWRPACVRRRPPPRRTARTAAAAPLNDRLTQLVVEEIRRVAKERADGMTLDSPIVETGMDSLERMEILASLEEKFGGRFPEEVLPELETTRQLVAAVEKYLGTEPRPPSVRPADAEIPPATYRFDQFPST